MLAVWEKFDSESLEMIKKQKAFEDETAKRLTALSDSTKNPLVKLLIHRIILDTMRHSDTYQILIELDKRALVGDTSQETMAKELATHIKEENRMLDHAKKISKSIKDGKFRQILEHIVEDEGNHHKILQELSEIIRKEASEWNRYFYEISTAFP